jgi:hypothetical protein
MSSHLISAPAQVRALAKAVSAAFVASPLSEEERNPGRVELVDLPWVAPPLATKATLGGVPLSDYLNAPAPVDEALLRRFWLKTLDDLWYRPSNAMRRGAFANCSWGMPKVRLGQRAYFFSVPVGYPARLEMSAGAMFSIEVAHVAAQSLPVLDVVSDEDNYHVILPDRSIIGVKNGRPACESPWDESVSGMVQDMLETSRGEADYECRFDQLAMLRSVLNVHRRRIAEFQGMDYALQALRILTLGGHCPELATQLKLLPLDLPLLRRTEQVYRDCIEIVDDIAMTDRSKLQIWHNLLVPEIISATKFKHCVFAGAQFPYALAQKKLESIRAWFEDQYRALPANLQREGVCKPVDTP